MCFGRHKPVLKQMLKTNGPFSEHETKDILDKAHFDVHKVQDNKT